MIFKTCFILIFLVYRFHKNQKRLLQLVALRSPINMKSSYLDNNRLSILLVLCKSSDVKDFCGLHEVANDPLFSRIDFDLGISSQIYRIFHHYYHFYQTYKVQKSHESETVQ